MRKVIGIGETVLDIIFKNGQPVSAVPGGSVYNGIISLGRAGVPAAFVSEVGNDRIGERTVAFLRENGVDASLVNSYKGTKSPISLAFLNDRNDAEYIFYKDHPHDRLDYVTPEISRDDIVMIGSYYAVNPVIRPQVAALLNERKDRIFCVRGNCDAEVDQMMLDFPILAQSCILYAGKRLIYACHGHQKKKGELPSLRPGEILLCGHTHIPAWEMRGDNLYLNPGSVSLPKEDSWRGYLLLTQGEAVWKDLEGKERHRLEL